MVIYEKKIHKDGHEYIEITGYEGQVQELVVPGEIEGLPVEAIGNHAFSGRQDIRTVVLPESIKTLYGFAFHNCKSLRKITLFDSLDDYYDGVCRQCDALEEIEITVNKSWFEVVRNFLADSDKTLRFMMHIKDEGDVCLTFPEYVYDFNENTMARTIQFSIAGSGYAYRECVDRRSINYSEYDKLFEKAVIDGNEISENIAIGRLLYPHGLLMGYREKYEQFVRKNDKSIMIRLVGRYETQRSDELLDMISKLTAYQEKVISEEAIDAALKLSTAKQLTRLNAVLMGRQKPQAAIEDEFVF
jgi:hypothetical protein